MNQRWSTTAAEVQLESQPKQKFLKNQQIFSFHSLPQN
jgi:hypothetical protein